MITSSPEIKQFILDWYRRIESGEMVAAAEQVLSKEPAFLALGTDTTEWFDVRTDLIEAYKQTEKLGKPVIDVRRLVAYCEGSVGWAVDTVLFTRPGKRQIEMRHTFVLHLENGEWKVIHAHYSFPTPDDGQSDVEHEG